MPRLSSIEGIESQIKISERKLSRLKKETQETCAYLAKLHEDLRQKKVSNLLLEIEKSRKSYEEILRLIRI